MVNLRNRNLAVQLPLTAQAAPGVNQARGCGQVRGVRARAGRAQVDPPPYQAPPTPQPDNEYHLLLMWMGLTAAAIGYLESLGLSELDDFCNISEKDIPSITKELCHNNILIRQTSPSYLHALRYWVMRKEHLQVNYTPEQFSDFEMRVALMRYQCSLDPPSHDMIKTPSKTR
jgi:hypothetical protein